MSVIDNYKSVSYVIPVYNLELYIGKCIRSIFEQNYKNGKIEIIVVNDASTDNSLNVIERTFKEFYNKTGYECVGNYKVIDLKENGGPGNALNVGFKAASGEYICFLSADDNLSNEDKTIIQSIFMDLYDSDLSYYTHFLSGTDKERIPYKSDYKVIEGKFIFGLSHRYVTNHNYLLYLLLNIKNPINSSSIMFNKESYFKFGEWDPLLRADCDGNLLFKYALHGAKILPIEVMMTPIFYRIHPGQVSNQSDLMSESQKTNRLKYKTEVLNGNYPLWLKMAMRFI
jgi:glycosyltransferase involved in cell wall biosynthesis